LRIARVACPRRVTFNGGAIPVRQTVPRLEAHHAVAVEQKNRRAVRVRRLHKAIDRLVVHLLGRAGLAERLGHAIDRSELLEAPLERAGRLTLIGDVATDADVAHRSPRAIADRELRQLEHTLLSVLA